MGTYTRSHSFTSGEKPTEAQWNVDIDGLITLCNGQIDKANVDSSSTDGIVTMDEAQTVTGRKTFSVDQPYQIAVLTDFCNECGNCVTACPTSGMPYEDKPRLYLNEDEFDAQTSNAFMVRAEEDQVTVLGRFEGTTHRLSVNGSIEYSAPSVAASFDASFGLQSATAAEGAADGTGVSLEPAATMFALWKGLDSSMPEVPTFSEAGTRIPAPVRPA